MYDVIVIGGGVSGLSSAIFTAKAGLSTAVFNKGQSQITRVSSVQNIPGYPDGISGVEWVNQARKQVEKFQGELIEEAVTELKKNENGLFEIKTEDGSFKAKYVIVATNANKDLLLPFGLEAEVNSFVPSGKTKSIPNIPWNGQTDVDNLYVAGLVTEIPSQLSVALGHGASVGIAVASKENNKAYMWHDI